MNKRDPLNVCVLGASTDTGNLGVSALCLSILRELFRREPDASVTVFGDNRGVAAVTETFDGRAFTYRHCGLHYSRRVYRSESLWNIRVSSLLGGGLNPAARALREADAVLDITGGDSFTDLYGMKRFEGGCVGKRLALSYSGGLVLMPQTYGPFGSDGTRREAARLVAESAAAWARDAASFRTLRELAGGAFDPARHRSGVDVAFRLGVRQPDSELSAQLARWLDTGRDAPVVGVNVSGLTWNDAERARRDFGLAADYRAAVTGVLDRLLARTRARIVLVPHVLSPPGHFESDLGACRHALDLLGERARGRVEVAPEMGAQQAKWLISRLDWFCGTRMHSAIAALSSGVPCAALAYSLKTRGVFETCGQGDHVADLRSLDAAAVVEAVWRSWEARDDARASLATSLPSVIATADDQMDHVVATCRALASRRRRTACSR